MSIGERRRALMGQLGGTNGPVNFGEYVKIIVTPFTIEENNGVTNTANIITYLSDVIQRNGVEGTLIGFSLKNKQTTLNYNEIVAKPVSNSSGCYRYRNGTISSVAWSNAGYEAVLTPGREIYIFTMVTDVT